MSRVSKDLEYLKFMVDKEELSKIVSASELENIQHCMAYLHLLSRDVMTNYVSIVGVIKKFFEFGPDDFDKRRLNEILKIHRPESRIFVLEFMFKNQYLSKDEIINFIRPIDIEELRNIEYINWNGPDEILKIPEIANLYSVLVLMNS